MRKRTARISRPTHLSNRGIGTLPWSYFVLIAICGCVIAAGFLLAARQHFVSMDLGMKNSKLRKQLEDLEAENRRLLLARERSLSPIELTRTAKSLGFAERPIAGQQISAPATPIMTVPAPAVPASVSATPRKPGPEGAVTRTSFQRPARQSDPPTTSVLGRERIVKVPESQKKKSEKDGPTPAARLR